MARRPHEWILERGVKFPIPLLKKKMAAEALAALQKATTEAERRAALLQAMPFNTDAHPEPTRR